MYVKCEVSDGLVEDLGWFLGVCCIVVKGCWIILRLMFEEFNILWGKEWFELLVEKGEFSLVWGLLIGFFCWVISVVGGVCGCGVLNSFCKLVWGLLKFFDCCDLVRLGCVNGEGGIFVLGVRVEGFV